MTLYTVVGKVICSTSIFYSIDDIRCCLPFLPGQLSQPTDLLLHLPRHLRGLLQKHEGHSVCNMYRDLNHCCLGELSLNFLLPAHRVAQDACLLVVLRQLRTFIAPKVSIVRLAAVAGFIHLSSSSPTLQTMSAGVMITLISYLMTLGLDTQDLAELYGKKKTSCFEPSTIYGVRNTGKDHRVLVSVRQVFENTS